VIKFVCQERSKAHINCLEKCVDLRQFRNVLAKTFLRSLRPKEADESKTGTLGS
jgi:hypothetical protein